MEGIPPKPSPDPAASLRGERALFALVLAVALAFRVREALRTPFWFDEIYSLQVVRRGGAAMWELIAGDIHPPLPTLLLALWRAVGGESPLWLKTLPMLFGLGVVWATWRLARALFGPRAGLLAAALVAVHPSQVYFGQEIRCYGMLTFALVLAAWRAWCWVGSGRPRDAVLAVLAEALVLHVHYMGGYVLALMDLWVLLLVLRTPRRALAWIAWHALVLVALLPLAGLMPKQLLRSGSHWVASAPVSSLSNLARRFAFDAGYLVPAVAVLALLPLARGPQRRAAAYLAWLGIATVLGAFALTRAGLHLYTERYMFFAVPFVCVLVAAGVVGLRWRRAAALLAVALLAFGVRAAIVKRPMIEARALKVAAGLIAPELRPGDLVFATDTHSLACTAYHLRDDRGRLLMSWPTVPYYVGGRLLPDSLKIAPDSVRRASRLGRRWWAVRTREDAVPTATAAAMLDSFARGGKVQIEHVTVWASDPGMLAPGH